MTGKDEPPFKDWRNRITSMGPDWRSFPSAWWGRDDWAIAEARYQPLNETLPAPAPTRVLPAGFRLFPGQRAPETPGERAAREIRAKKIGTVPDAEAEAVLPRRRDTSRHRAGHPAVKWSTSFRSSNARRRAGGWPSSG